MSYISERRARIARQLAAVQAQLNILYDAMLEMVATGVQSYEFDSGEGKQRTTRRTFKDTQDLIDRLEAKEASLLNSKYSNGLVTIRLRRKKGGGYNNNGYPR